MGAPRLRAAAAAMSSLVLIAGCAMSAVTHSPSAPSPATEDPFTGDPDRTPRRWAAAPSTGAEVAEASGGRASGRAPSATLTPGVQTYTADAGQCTANFVFVDARGTVYLGQAAHCGSLGDDQDHDGCRTASVPLGHEVDFRRSGSLLDSGVTIAVGTLAYSSWITMQADHEADRNACDYNDFALVAVPPARVGEVNPVAV